MARQMRAFTFDVATLVALDNVTTKSRNSPWIQELMLHKLEQQPIIPEDKTPENLEPLDGMLMRSTDYAVIYAMLPPPKEPSRWDAFDDEKRHLNWESCVRIICRHPKRDLLLKALRARQSDNRNAQRRLLTKKKRTETQQALPREFKLNASRIADAIMILGLETLKERVARLDIEGSARKNASKTKK